MSRRWWSGRPGGIFSWEKEWERKVERAQMGFGWLNLEGKSAWKHVGLCYETLPLTSQLTGANTGAARSTGYMC